jgi:hypothetical protein
MVAYMTEEFEELIASFQVAEDLEQTVDLTIQSRLGEFAEMPMTALPFGDAGLVEEHTSLRVKRVESRVIERLRAA